MRYFFYTVIVGFALSSPVALFGQSSDLDTIFGKRSKHPCIVERNAGFTKSCMYYNFSDEYSIGIELDAESRILSVTLAPKGAADDLENSITDKNKTEFLSLVARARPLGSLRFSGENQSSEPSRFDGWDVYENAIVMRSGQVNGEAYELRQVKVFFPSYISGLVSEVGIMSVGKGFGIQIVVIDGCSFFTTDKDVRCGSQGTFAVFGPRNSCMLRLTSIILRK